VVRFLHLRHGRCAGVQRLFFPKLDPRIGTLAAFATFGVGFFARPFGGLVFGHFGDRIGRKPMLVVTLLLVGVATFLIGLIPSYASIGILAPILLVVLRLLQGFGAGAEYGGAVIFAVEYAPEGRRGLFGSWAPIGVTVGNLLAAAVFAIVTLLSKEACFSWGWRIPFLLSAILVAVGLYIRVSVAETPVLTFPFFILCETKESWLIWLAFVGASAIGVSGMFGPQAAYYSELFGPRVRFGGFAFARELGSILAGGPAPFLAASLLDLAGGRPWWVAAYIIVLSLITAAAITIGRKPTGATLPQNIPTTSCRRRRSDRASGSSIAAGATQPPWQRSASPRRAGSRKSTPGTAPAAAACVPAPRAIAAR
jgi:Arabinose efflux permease